MASDKVVLTDCNNLILPRKQHNAAAVRQAELTKTMQQWRREQYNLMLVRVRG